MVKVGDKVRYTGPCEFNLTPGRVYEVERIIGSSFGVRDDVNEYNVKVSGHYELITTSEIGTLQELSVKPGDVVECVDLRSGSIFTTGMRYTVNQDNEIVSNIGLCCGTTTSTFRIISRASDDTPKKWRDMTDAEKGALLLAHYRGEVIEASVHGRRRWVTKQTDRFLGCNAYRIKPEPVRETVTGWWNGKNFHNTGNCCNRTHRITFDTINDEPDPDTIKMEKL